ncbi:MAG: dihydroorotate dehydrogenase electron transfer subunit [Clostridium sp.]|nr:dihydroorotate dehydrogenase electron transfer subunit [Clostridium sp.]
MKKILNFRVVANTSPAPGFSILEMEALGVDAILPEAKPGQFVQVRVSDSPATFLRRPISIYRYDRPSGRISLLIRNAGEGTAHLCALAEGGIVNMIVPLGNGFPLDPLPQRPVLIGGGVGVAPLLMLGEELARRGSKPTFLTGARNAAIHLLRDEFAAVGELHVTTDDGSLGHHGVVTAHPVVAGEAVKAFDAVYCCGPAPMMKAVAALARRNGIPCYVSLENMMACGVGACLCCVEKTIRGNVCVCTEGPVFNIEELTW